MKRLLAVLLVLSLAACGTVRKIETGAQTVGERMSVTIDGHWNHVDFPGIKPAQLWTMEGVTIDEFLVYAGVKDGQAMHADTSNPKRVNVSFRSTMQVEEIVAMFEGVLARDDSTFKLIKLEPFPFGGKKGFRFEYERIRKMDGVQLRGVAFGAVDKGELFALVYHAPRLTFFPRHQGRVETIARSTVIR